MIDLSNIDELKQACSGALENALTDSEYVQWGKNLREFLADVRTADLKTRASKEFQQRIWDNNPVSSPGQGFISVDVAIADPEFRNWLAERSMEDLPDAPERRKAALDSLYGELEEKVCQYTSRTPRLKIYRVLAGLFPLDFTTVANIELTKRVHAAMFGERGGAGPSCHANILRQLDEVRGPAPAEDEIDAIVDRMRLPWLLYQHCVAPSNEERTVSPSVLPGEERLEPLPAARRRKGLTGVSGGRQALLSILEFCRDGVTREALVSHMKTVNPRLKESSIGTQINVIASELNCLRVDGSRIVLTDRGHAFLESDDPEVLMDWLVTRVLGVDHAFVILRDETRCSPQEFVQRIQKVNPGWTSTWGPQLIIKELRAFDMLELDDSNLFVLSDVGNEWAQRIHWQPEALEPRGNRSDELIAVPVEPEPVAVNLPAFSHMHDEILKRGHFPERVIRRLHAGLWANERRHFAVLTGLSGSGKTLLARAYGEAVAGENGGNGRQLCTVPVQPGWYDPSALLGYVNPLQGDSYVRTPILEFLIGATDAPDRPFTVVLDEMNLSRPEQYLAPILSAMETGEALTLHSEGDMFDGVPAQIRYPSNLAIIGTVNMDETTHGISDKVLDRAFTIEFWDVDLEAYPRWGKRGLSGEQENEVCLLLADLMVSLRPARLHFGWRVVDDVLDYTHNVMADEGAPSLPTVLDDVVYAKVLPKLRGEDSTRFREALGKAAEVLKRHGLGISARKVEELSDDLESTGSARFWR
ncbi:MAG: restriction endonuclease [Gammaproteobacteria bacterium]|nr:restriction endonuclease [Gammaproteobacteria bacterium]MYE52093.1 restriction endonuclease [Gammaproteobacteria bacterium]MYF09755.1 restriction endonuclease [Gammaproteobacteria bacterium]MYF49841.1 restriction endonuclease [Gammaproteobacteria bacterium]MYH16063.1 restriction endonuclease [Gammaproteobacteria bacterium]